MLLVMLSGSITKVETRTSSNGSTYAMATLKAWTKDGDIEVAP